ncbi:hypothetical protein [Serratia bockelmannii]|uniref:hypothetical protein n=1 Tax=Serratia bockelmannii TaxID=2703793 RepID=UPI00331479D2
MSTEKLSELSKPVAYTDADELRFHHATSDMWPVPLGFGKDVPLYSQEYVSALKHESAVNWEAAASMNVENQELKKRIAELEGQLQSGFTPEALAQEERAENAEQRVAELEARLVVEIEPPPVIYPGRYDCHAMHSAIRRAGFRVAGDSEHVGDVDMRDERALTAVSDKQRIAELEAKLATPVRLLGEMLLHDWEHRVERQAAFEHRKIAWDARLAEDKKAILAAGFTFTVEGDE